VRSVAKFVLGSFGVEENSSIKSVYWMRLDDAQRVADA
jgi:hypothetical protein